MGDMDNDYDNDGDNISAIDWYEIGEFGEVGGGNRLVKVSKIVLF